MSTPDRDIPFTCADPWLLQAVMMAARDRAASLKDVVAAGDAINHAIFSFEELNGGLARLAAADLVSIDGDTFSLTDQTRKFAADTAQHRTVFAQRDALRAYLEAPEWSADYDPTRSDPDWQAAAFSRDDLSKACKAYHREFKQAYRKLREQEGS